eukprot:478202_1
MATGHSLLCVVFTFAMLLNIGKCDNDTYYDGVTENELYDVRNYSALKQPRAVTTQNPPAIHPTLNPTSIPTKTLTSTGLQNTIKLYDYHWNPEANMQEMETASTLHQAILSADKQNKLVIIQHHRHLTFTSTQDHRVSAFSTRLDDALEVLDQLLLPVLDSGGDMAFEDLQFNHGLFAFITQLRPLHAIHRSIIEEFKVCCVLQKQTNAGSLFISIIQDPELRGFWPVAHAQSLWYKNSAFRFLLIAYQTLLALKVEETNDLITNTSYAMSGAIPTKYQSEFEALRKTYNRQQILQMSCVIDE